MKSMKKSTRNPTYNVDSPLGPPTFNCLCHAPPINGVWPTLLVLCSRSSYSELWNDSEASTFNSVYVIIHDKTNHISLGINLR